MALEPCTLHLRPYLMLDWLGKVPVTNNVDTKLTNWQIGSASFTMANKYQNDWYFSAHLLPFVKIQELHIKENQLIVRPNIQNDHHSKIKSLGTLDGAFPALSHIWLTGYSTGDK